MSSWGERWRLVATAVVCLALTLLGAALLPTGAAALDSDLKHTYVFRVEASNGYRILAIANSERADGRGEIGLYVTRGLETGVYYVAPATLSATRIDADLGALGQVALDVTPSRRKAKVRSHCGDEAEIVNYEPQFFSGSFEFHGEEGFAAATSAAPHDSFRLLIGCGGRGFGEELGADLPGARLSLRSPVAGGKLRLQVKKNAPRGNTRIEASIWERRGEIGIVRVRGGFAAPRAFEYDASLRTATIDLPEPFSGHGTFHSDAAPSNRWNGDFAIDFPGRSNVPLSGNRSRATLVHARFTRG